MRLRVVVALLALGFVVSACAPSAAPPAEPKPDLAAEERAIREVDGQWAKAAQAHDAAGEASVFAADGVAYRPNVEPIVGPAAFQAFSEQFYKDNPKAASTWSADTITVAESGELAVEVGTYKLTGLGPKGEADDTGKFVTVWKKMGGAWKVSVDIGSTTVPLPPAKK